ncbi:MAG: sugar transferase [Ignavibacteriales bacterium]|nr:sugar transferase [Ignavibacteriales bacterium]MCF8315091.1 sugar transferase [Ignavibacteriales bacterium]MCF8435913.1 sugar transferase [Ignavibacteriales bacterium]
MYISFFKRIIDILLSAAGIIIISPLLLVVIILLLYANKGKPFFVQERPGKNEKPFKLIKFKTMSDKRDSKGNLLSDKERMTKVGIFLRGYSLDELPQLFNVLAGSMSLVGPRPLLFKYIPLYSETQRKRHDLKPGITGLAQVNGRNSISWTKKFEYDVEYVENVSFLLDLKILYSTVIRVINRHGINQSAERPMLPFNGSN